MSSKRPILLLVLALAAIQDSAKASSVAHKVRTVRTSTVTIYGWENSLAAKSPNLKKWFWIPIEASKQNCKERIIMRNDPNTVAHQTAMRCKTEPAAKHILGKSVVLKPATTKPVVEKTSVAENVRAEVSYKKSIGYSAAYDNNALSSTAVHACILKK